MGTVAYEHRATALERRRHRKMGRSVEAYVRGSTVDFYRWLGEGSDHGIPEGPPVWICGDCHLGNLGPLADADGSVRIDIRDFDQTVIGNPAHDLIRMGLSFASAARSGNLSGHDTTAIIETLAGGYAQGVREGGMARDPSTAPKFLRKAKRRAVKRGWKQLAKERFAGEMKSIPQGKRFWPVTSDEKARIVEIIKSDGVRRSLFDDADEAAVEVRDAAYWRKGCSSLGLLRYAVLLDVGGKPMLVDIKEAVTSAAPRNADADMPPNEGDRIVAGARALAPLFGNRIASAVLGDRTVFVRALAPQDLKLDLERLKKKKALRAADYLGKVVGHAHARQMTPDHAIEWLDQIQVRQTSKIDAPSWLWSPVITLVGEHERAYLDFCKRHPM